MFYMFKICIQSRDWGLMMDMEADKGQELLG